MDHFTRLRKALNTFGSKKAPGLDGLTPEVLKLLSDECLDLVAELYNEMLSLNYTPSNLRTSKVIMIPKAGKPDYSIPKAYRPITLTPFLFKLLERVNAWDIMETALKSNPLHKRQHAYRMRRSTESAISQVLNEIEKGLNTTKGFALATCIDISSAFDRLNPVKAVEALIKKGVNRSIALWHKDYLTNRHAHIDIKGVQTIRHITVGCPQGGVLSTLLWNIAFDDMLSLFNTSRVICVGYADDGCLIITGKDIKNLYQAMNEALNLCQAWAEAYGLDISPGKTEYMLCTRQLRKSYKIPLGGLRLKGVEIDRSESIKYLGLTVNQKLNWGAHIDEKVRAAKRHIFRLKGFIGKTWGPCPEMTKLAYTTCIRPAMTYSSFAFAHTGVHVDYTFTLGLKTI